MNRPGKSFCFFMAMMAWVVLALQPAICAENPSLDKAQSTRLTDFLKSNRLPLVSAQVLRSSGGGQSVMLYGYTATELGKSNAEKRTRLFLNDPKLPITNRIIVRPELASMRSPSKSAPPPQGSTEAPPPRQPGDIESYQSQQYEATRQRYANQQAQQYMSQQYAQSSLLNTLIPLVLLGLALGLGGSGGGVMVSPGCVPSDPYCGAYRGPYGGYGYPYGTRP